MPERQSIPSPALGIICCRVLEREVRALAAGIPEVGPLEVMEWGLHARPEVLAAALTDRIRALEGQVGAVLLGYGRCQALHRLPRDFKVPVFYPEGDDCIGVLLGQDRYEEALLEEAGTWFLTPGWTELGLDFIFRELQVQRLADRGLSPLEVARRMFKDYQRALFIDLQLGDHEALVAKAREITALFNWRLDFTRGSLARLQTALDQARQALRASA